MFLATTFKDREGLGKKLLKTKKIHNSKTKQPPPQPNKIQLQEKGLKFNDSYNAALRCP